MRSKTVGLPVGTAVVQYFSDFEIAGIKVNAVHDDEIFFIGKIGERHRKLATLAFRHRDAIARSRKVSATVTLQQGEFQPALIDTAVNFKTEIRQAVAGNDAVQVWIFQRKTNRADSAIPLRRLPPTKSAKRATVVEIRQIQRTGAVGRGLLARNVGVRR